MDDENDTAWKKTMGYFLNKCGNFNLGDGILCMKTKNWMAEGLPDFYKEMMGAWGKFLTIVHFEPRGRENILNQPLFLNNRVLKQGKEIFFRKWWEVGITRVRDVLYEFKEGFLPVQCIIDAMEEAKEDFSTQEIINKYEVIKNAIPKEWIERIENMEEGTGREFYVKVGEKCFDFKLCTVKMFYSFFRDGIFKIPIANEYWLKKFDDLEENDIWGNMRGTLVETKLENLEYFIRHRVVFTDAFLNKLGMEQTPICKVCHDDEEGFLHLFSRCKGLEGANAKCREIIGHLKGEKNVRDFEWNKIVMLGVDKKSKNNKLINLLVMLFKSATWERRVVAKREGIVLDVERVFKRKVEKYVECLFLYFKQEDKMDEFYNVFTPEVCKVFDDLQWKVPR